MKVFTSLEHLSIEDKTAVAMGTFDGVHKAHMVIINKMLEVAKAKQLKSAVFTFTNVPRHTNEKPFEVSQLLSSEEKLEIFKSLGIDIVVILPFDEKVKQIKHTTIMDYLKEKLNIQSLFIGYNFKFGYQAKGTTKWLVDNAPNYNFTCNVISLIDDGEGAISSTRIRSYLKDGQIEKANALLGRHYFVTGIVKTGKQLGRTIGFPTANLTVKSHMTNIKSGIYITETTADGKCYQSVTNVGFNPTFEQTDFNLETYLFNFNEDLYGKYIKVAFIKRIRDELKFKNAEELKKWIAKDVETAKKYFNIT